MALLQRTVENRKWFYVVPKNEASLRPPGGLTRISLVLLEKNPRGTNLAPHWLCFQVMVLYSTKSSSMP